MHTPTAKLFAASLALTVTATGIQARYGEWASLAFIGALIIAARVFQKWRAAR